MKKNFPGITILLLLSGLLLSQEKQIKIGECRWYTGQNGFEDILNIAKENDKPVLAVYSASWCGPCQRMRKNILSSKKFRSIEKEAILLFIEFAEKGGKKFVEKHKIIKFPTLKLFSQEGDELDTEIPGETVNSMLQWVRQVKEREKFVKRLEKNPTDWDALFKATEQRKESLYTSDQYEPTIALLRNALEASDNSDNLKRQQVYERLANYLYLTMINKQGPRSQGYARKHKEEFTHIIRFYYPDKFRYELKKQNPLAMWINWLTKAGDYRDAVRVFENALPAIEKNLDPIKNMNLLEGIITSYLALDWENKAEMWVRKINHSYESELEERSLTLPPLPYLRIILDIIEYKYNKGDETSITKYFKKLLRVIADAQEKLDGKTLYKSFPNFENIIKFFHQKGMKAEVKEVAAILEKIIDNFEDESCKTFTTIRFAKRYGVYVDKALKKLADKKRMMYPGFDTYTIINRAVLLSKKGERKKADRLISQVYKKIKNSKGINKISRSKTLNSLAWATYEMGAVNKKSLEMAEKSVELSKNSHNLDTLATIQAELGNFGEAIKIGREALSLAKGEKEQVLIEEKLARWQKEIE